METDSRRGRGVYTVKVRANPNTHIPPILVLGLVLFTCSMHTHSLSLKATAAAHS